MKIVIAMMKHETNTFSPVPTNLARFGRGQDTPFYGRQAYEAFKGTGAAIGAFIDLAEEAGAEIDIPVAANAWPSGPVDDKAFEHIVDLICESVDRGCDAVMLDLHGAMVTESFDDGEGELVARLRKIDSRVPIAVALDMHANLYESMVRNVTVISGYHTYPHIDVYETGARAGRTILRTVRGEVRPTMIWGNRPMLPHVMRQGTDDSPNRELQEMARNAEDSGTALIASLFTGFPHADIENAGTSAVVVTDNDPAAAQDLCDRLLGAAWGQRNEFIYKIEPLEASIARAKAMRGGPVILLDHYDNCASGGTMDSTQVLAEVLRQGLEDVAVFAICDPAVVSRMAEAGVGAEVEIDLGGKTEIPSMTIENPPLRVCGRVCHLSNGQYRNNGPMSKGVLMDMGSSAVLDTGRVEIVVISRQQEPNDLGCLMSQGIDPKAKRYLMIKSRIHYRAAFMSIASEVVECAGAGVCTSDYSQLRFTHVRRPIFPLDRSAFGD